MVPADESLGKPLSQPDISCATDTRRYFFLTAILLLFYFSAVPPLSRGVRMREETERWKELCAQAVKEQDPNRLHQLTTEICRLLEEKEARLKEARKTVSRTDPNH